MTSHPAAAETSHPSAAEVAVEERFREFAASEKLRYQSMTLPGGVTTPGIDRSYMNDILFGDGFENQTLLDIGSYLGYFCLEAIRRGAAGATGIEPDRENFRQAGELAELFSLPAEYICDDFETWDHGERRFDTVICLNVLHHMYDAVHAIRRMMTLARRRVVIEFVAPTLRDLWLGSLNPLLLAARSQPLMILGAPKQQSSATRRSYMFTAKAMEVLFNTHSAAFEPVSIRRSPYDRRLIVDARKRRIKNLVVVAGATAGGKTTLVERLQQDSRLREATGVEGTDWTSLGASCIGKLPSGPIETFVLQYDLMRCFKKSLRTFDRDPISHFIDTADRITFITILTPPERLERQLRESHFGPGSEKQSRKQTELLTLYRNPRFMRSWYEAWLDFCARFAPRTSSSVLVLNEDRGYAMHPPRFWRQHFDRYYPDDAWRA